jgi:hypothetical protein
MRHGCRAEGRSTIVVGWQWGAMLYCALRDVLHASWRWRERLKPTWSWQDVRVSMNQYTTYRLAGNLGYGPYTKSTLLQNRFLDEP